jgi:hypothetical protein
MKSCKNITLLSICLDKPVNIYYDSHKVIVEIEELVALQEP